MRRVTELHVLATGPGAYFLPAHALLLYGAAPLVLLSSFVFFLAPGALLVLLRGRCASLVELLLHAFGASVLLVIALDLVLKAVVGLPVPRSALPLLWAVVTAAAAAGLLARTVRGAQLASPFEPQHAATTALDGGSCLHSGGAAHSQSVLGVVQRRRHREAFEFGRSLRYFGAAQLDDPGWRGRDCTRTSSCLLTRITGSSVCSATSRRRYARAVHSLHRAALSPRCSHSIEGSHHHRMHAGHEALWAGLALYAVVADLQHQLRPVLFRSGGDGSDRHALDGLLSRGRPRAVAEPGVRGSSPSR